jgi:signal transduction histidine kinase
VHLPTTPSIILIDSDDSDRTLATLLLQRELPNATVLAPIDAGALAEALATQRPDVVIVSASLAWRDVEELITAIKRANPTRGVVLFGHEYDILLRGLNPGLACDAMVRKNSAGFMRLPGLVTELLERARRVVEAAASAVQAPKAGERTHQEMRDIALVFSHDLQEPLQQIVRLARMGLTTDDGRMPSRSLQRVLECAARASTMLDDMLEYLTVAARDSSPTVVDLSQCLRKAVENLRSRIDESHAEVRAARLPTTVGDEHQLLHLFQNLLSNAIKFRGRERPLIDIFVEAQGPQWLVSFRDNGIGIPPAHLERIFTPGQRLHTRDEYPGSGLGLALCRRIVERHGGRIWATSDADGGSTFHILLPQAAAVGARPPARQGVAAPTAP